MIEWMTVTKTTEAHKRGLKQELDTCLITVAFFVSASCKKKFLSSFTGEKEGLLKRNPCRHEDSLVLFCHFLPLF